MAVNWKRTTVLSLCLLRFCFVCFSDKTYHSLPRTASLFICRLPSNHYCNMNNLNYDSITTTLCCISFILVNR